MPSKARGFPAVSWPLYILMTSLHLRDLSAFSWPVCILVTSLHTREGRETFQSPSALWSFSPFTMFINPIEVPVSPICLSAFSKTSFSSRPFLPFSKPLFLLNVLYLFNVLYLLNPLLLLEADRLSPYSKLVVSKPPLLRTRCPLSWPFTTNQSLCRGNSVDWRRKTGKPCRKINIAAAERGN